MPFGAEPTWESERLAAGAARDAIGTSIAESTELAATPRIQFTEVEMNRNSTFKTCLLAASSLTLIALAGCANPPAETAGKKTTRQ